MVVQRDVVTHVACSRLDLLLGWELAENRCKIELGNHVLAQAKSHFFSHSLDGDLLKYHLGGLWPLGPKPDVKGLGSTQVIQVFERCDPVYFWLQSLV